MFLPDLFTGTEENHSVPQSTKSILPIYKSEPCSSDDNIEIHITEIVGAGIAQSV
jgi:hypothetical protein